MARTDARNVGGRGDRRLTRRLPEARDAARTGAPERRGGDLEARRRQPPSSDFWPGELWVPQIEIFQRGDDLVVRADLPGIQREEVTVEVGENALAIHGERRRECARTGVGFYDSERSYGSFHRRIRLSDTVDPDTVRARFADGVLEMTMRATAPAEHGRRIEIAGETLETGETRRTRSRS